MTASVGNTTEGSAVFVSLNLLLSPSSIRSFAVGKLVNGFEASFCDVPVPRKCSASQEITEIRKCSVMCSSVKNIFYKHYIEDSFWVISIIFILSLECETRTGGGARVSGSSVVRWRAVFESVLWFRALLFIYFFI